MTEKNQKQALNISLKPSKRPILCLQIFHLETEQILFLSTMDSYLFIFKLASNEQISKKCFKSKKPVSCISFHNKICTFGCTSGHIGQLDVEQLFKQNRNDTQIAQSVSYYSGQSTNSVRPEMLAAYQRENIILAWNLNSQVFVIDSETKQDLSMVCFEYDITATLVLYPKKQESPKICVAFANKYLPFVFDCSDNLRGKYESILKDCKQNQQQCQQEHVMLASCPNSSKVVILSLPLNKQQSSGSQTAQCFITVCSLEQEIPYLTPLYKLSIQLQDFHFMDCSPWIHLHKSLLIIKVNNKSKIINIDQWPLSQSYYSCSLRYVEWVAFQQIKENQKGRIETKLLLSKGFNIYNPKHSEARTLHIKKLSFYLQK